jgi:hypothetical protein
MSTITLPDDTEIELTQIESVTLSKKGASLGARVVSVPMGDSEDLTVAEDVLAIRLKDGSEVAVRGDDAEDVFGALSQLQDDYRMDFRMEIKHPSSVRH